MQQCTALFYARKEQAVNEFKLGNPYEIELRVRIGAEAHKQLVEYCAQRRTTRDEVVRSLIYELLEKNRNK